MNLNTVLLGGSLVEDPASSAPARPFPPAACFRNPNPSFPGSEPSDPDFQHPRRIS